MEIHLMAIDEKLSTLDEEVLTIRKEVEDISHHLPRAAADMSALLSVMERIEDALLRIESRLDSRY